MSSNISEIQMLRSSYIALWHQIIQINLLAQDLKYLHPQESKVHELVHYLPLLERLKESHKMNFALRLCIILNPKEDSNLLSFVRRLILKQKKASWGENLSIRKLKEHERILNSILLSVEFETIKHMRDKIYAHVDKSASNTELFTTLDKLLPIVDELMKIIQELGSGLFKTDFEIRLPEWNVDHSLLSLLSNFFEVQENITRIKNGSKDELNLENIDDWLRTY